MTNYHYCCLPQIVYELNEYKLEAVKPKHIEKIRLWRNEQMEVLRQEKTITKEEQIQYYKNQIWSELKIENPKQILFSFMKNKELIGYGGLVHIDWRSKSAESSFLLDKSTLTKSKDYKRLFKIFFFLLKKIAFEDLKLLKISSETYSNRHNHIKLLEEAGYKKMNKQNRKNSVLHKDIYNS